HPSRRSRANAHSRRSAAAFFPAKNGGRRPPMLLRMTFVFVARVQIASRQWVRSGGQVSARGFVPRLSAGTLQLSTRCSSLHLLPRLSWRVRAGPEESLWAGGGAAGDCA